MLTAELEEVIVTAQKKSQDIQDVAGSVGTLLDDVFNELMSGGAHATALSGRVASLLVESSNGRLAPRVYLRGVGNVDFDVNASQPISFVYDDVVLENPVAKSFPLFDLQRMELLRGPQGTLFGRNTTAGVVKFVSNPPAETRETSIRLAVGQRGYRRGEIAISGPFGQQASGRIALLYDGMEDWIDNLAPGYQRQDAIGGYQDFAIKAAVKWETNDRLDLGFDFKWRDMSDGTPSVFYGNVVKPGTNELVESFKVDQVFLDAAENHFQHVDQWGVTLNVNYLLENAKLVSITGIHSIGSYLSRGDVDGGYGSVYAGVLPSGPRPGVPFDAQTADGIDGHMQLTQELRIEGSTGDREWRLGAYRFSEDLVIETFNYDSVINPGAQNGYVRQDQTTSAWALFGTYDAYASDRVTVTAGLRYSVDDKRFESQRYESPLSFLGIGGVHPPTINRKAKVLTWDFRSLIELNDQINAFARLAKGHRAPSAQGRLLFQDEISIGETEVNHSIELGLKSLLLDRRLRLNATVFKYVVDDFQVTKIGGAANLSELINLNELHGSGFEVEGDFLLNAELYFTFAISFNSSEIDDPNLTVNGCGSAAHLNGCTVQDPQSLNGEYSIHGNSLYNTPKNIFSGTANYIHVTTWGDLTWSLDSVWRSDVRFTLYESVENSSPSHWLLGARVSLKSKMEDRIFSLFVRNLKNEQILVGTVDFNNLTGFVNDPRLWGIQYEWLVK